MGENPGLLSLSVMSVVVQAESLALWLHLLGRPDSQ